MTHSQPEAANGAERASHEELSYSEHVVRVLVLGLAVAYTYILLS